MIHGTSSNLDTNPIHIDHPVDAVPLAATTTVNYTSTTCACSVSGHNITANVCTDLSANNAVAVRLPIPSYLIQGCNGSKLSGFKITVLPTRGVLSLNGVNVTANQVIAKSDWPSMIYTLTASNVTAGSDTFTFQVSATCGTSSNLTATLTIDTCYENLDDCGATTTIPVTTTSTTAP